MTLFVIETRAQAHWGLPVRRERATLASATGTFSAEQPASELASEPKRERIELKASSSEAHVGASPRRSRRGAYSSLSLSLVVKATESCDLIPYRDCRMYMARDSLGEMDIPARTDGGSSSTRRIERSGTHLELDVVDNLTIGCEFGSPTERVTHARRKWHRSARSFHFMMLRTVQYYRFTQAGILRAFNFPGFFLSTTRESRVTHPARESC